MSYYANAGIWLHIAAHQAGKSLCVCVQPRWGSTQCVRASHSAAGQLSVSSLNGDE